MRPEAPQQAHTPACPVTTRLTRPRVWVAEDFVPIHSDDEHFDYQESTASSVVVRVDFGDGVGRSIAWLNPETFGMDEVKAFLATWRDLATNISANFEDLIDYAQLAETLAERDGG